MSIGFFVAVGGFAWFDRWIETNITNLDNFKTIFVFLRFEIRQIEKSSSEILNCQYNIVVSRMNIELSISV